MNHSDDFFLKQMKGVRPIKKNNKLEKERPLKNIKKTKKTKKNKDLNLPNLTHFKKSSSEFNLENIKIKKNIKKKSLTINKKIDFHGKTILESEEEFSKTIIRCYNEGFRCLLFVTGKGLYKSQNFGDIKQPKLYHGVIRAAFVNWVKSKKFSKYILSYEVASIEHGGDGAFYVYLRKKIN